MASPSPDRGAGTSLSRGIGTLEDQSCSIILRDVNTPRWFSAKLFPRFRGKSFFAMRQSESAVNRFAVLKQEKHFVGYGRTRKAPQFTQTCQRKTLPQNSVTQGGFAQQRHSRTPFATASR